MATKLADKIPTNGTEYIILEQKKIIDELNKKIESLEEEKKILEESLKNLPKTLENNFFSNLIHPSVVIAEVQLQYLKNKSDKSELTYEEAKKVEIYTKILDSFNKKEELKIMKNISDKELLDIIEVKE